MRLYYLILLSSLICVCNSLQAQRDLVSSNLPIIVINTDSVEIQDEQRITAFMGVIANDFGQRNYLNEPFNQYAGKISIEFRGTSSLIFTKKSYSFETQNELGENLNVNLLGLPEENDWILYGPNSDKSLIRNALTYELGRRIGHYAPQTRFCELILNNEYRGVYVLIEKIRRDKARVDIAKLKIDEISGDDVSGGYILKIDRYDTDDPLFIQTDIGEVVLQVVYPDKDDIVPEQLNYIQSYLNEFEQTLLELTADESTRNFSEFIDLNSFLDFFIMNELSKNVDGFMLSSYLHKDKDSNGGKIVMGPLWDYNIAWGNVNYREGFKLEGFQSDINIMPWWWEKLLENKEFMDAVANRWCELRNSCLSSENISSIIDSLSNVVDEAQQRNYNKWEFIGQYVWPNYFTGPCLQPPCMPNISAVILCIEFK